MKDKQSKLKEKEFEVFEVVANVNLCYKIKAKSAEEAFEKAQEIELPGAYVEDSFEIVKAIAENGNEIYP